MDDEKLKAHDDFDPGFKVNVTDETLLSVLRQEAMINVLMTEVAKIKEKQESTTTKRTWKEIHTNMIEEAKKHLDRIYNKMQKYL